jgi:hypothetical protein
MVTVRVTLDNFGIADPMMFAAQLQKAGRSREFDSFHVVDDESGTR